MPTFQLHCAFAHKKGYLFRDFQCGNLMVASQRKLCSPTTDGESGHMYIILLDF